MAAFLDIDPASFDPANITEETKAFNKAAQQIMAGAPRWYEVGAPKYRQMRAAGETPLPKATLLASAEEMSITSRDANRAIPCRILRPQNGKQISAVFLHVHGGGWVLQDEKSQDPVLQLLADNTGLMCLSVGYRLAPEHRFPAGPNDCYDVAEYLVQHSTSRFGAPLGFLGGESAGAHLSMLVALHLLQHPDPTFNSFRFKGLLQHYGIYSLIWLPQIYNWNRDPCLILDRAIMDNFRDAFLGPGWTQKTVEDPKLSPLYADLQALRGNLPPALFTCGTEDPLLDDTLFMSTKWRAAGGEAVVKIVPGAPHGFCMFPREIKGARSEEGMRWVEEFIAERLRT